MNRRRCAASRTRSSFSFLQSPPLGILKHPDIACHAKRISPSGTLVALKVSRSASLSVAIPLNPMLPESSTETMTFGAAGLNFVPAGAVLSVSGAATVASGAASAAASKLNADRLKVGVDGMVISLFFFP